MQSISPSRRTCFSNDEQLNNSGAPAAYELACDNAEARAFLRAWLDEASLEWPGHFRIEVEVGDINPFPPDTREPFRQTALTVQGGPPSGVVRVTWEYAPAAAEIHPELPQARVWLSPAALKTLEAGERSFFLVVLIFVLRRIGWYHVHGASFIDPKGRGWLMAGDSNCGKSTTTALVASRGWKISTDDIGFLARGNDRIVSHGMRTTIGLRPGGVSLLGATGGRYLEERNKEAYWPEELGGAWSKTVTPEIIVFPRIGERTGVVRSTPRSALSSIVMWSIWVLCEPQFADEHLDVLGSLARQSRCYDLTLGPDLFDNPNLLEELIP